VTVHRDGEFTAERAEKNTLFLKQDRGSQVLIGHMKSFATKGLEAACRMWQKTGKISRRSPR